MSIVKGLWVDVNQIVAETARDEAEGKNIRMAIGLMNDSGFTVVREETKSKHALVMMTVDIPRGSIFDNIRATIIRQLLTITWDGRPLINVDDIIFKEFKS